MIDDEKTGRTPGRSTHEHSVARTESKPGRGIVHQVCACGAWRVADYRGLVGEIEPNYGAWKRAPRPKPPKPLTVLELADQLLQYGKLFGHVQVHGDGQVGPVVAVRLVRPAAGEPHLELEVE
jgi:hypothetical protein